MEENNEFRGVCPLCYKPIGNHEDTKAIQISGVLEISHAACVYDCIKQIGQERREKWISLQLDEWGAIGETLQRMREMLKISIKDMATSLGVSKARLRRFEKGEPVRDAKLLYHAYILKIYGDNSYRHVVNMHNQKHGIEKVYTTLEDLIGIPDK